MPLFRDLSKLTAVLASALALAACGGGDQEETFQPNRIVALGDENSRIEGSAVPPDGSASAVKGRMYTVNNVIKGTISPDGIACQNAPSWVQIVAADYGMPFPECGGGTGGGRTEMLASLGARVSDVAAAINTLNASGAPFNGKDLVILAVGTHDVLEIIGTNKSPSDAELAGMVNAATARGSQLGGLIQGLIGRGAKVLFATIPDLGYSPLTLPGYDNSGYSAGALSALSRAFNNGLNVSSEVANGGGRNGAVVQIDSLMRVYRDDSASYPSFVNRLDAACTEATATGRRIVPDERLPFDCLMPTTAQDGLQYYLWAGRVQFGLYTHRLIGNEAVARIRANPL